MPPKDSKDYDKQDVLTPIDEALTEEELAWYEEKYYEEEQFRQALNDYYERQSDCW